MGNVVEVGTHQELMSKGGHYFEMVELQNAGGNDDNDNEESTATADADRAKSDLSVTSLASGSSALEKDSNFGESDEAQQEEGNKPNKKISRVAVRKLTKPELPYNILTTFGGMMHGYSYAGFGMCIGQMMGALGTRDIEKSNFWTGMFAVHIAIGVSGAFLGGVCGGVSGSRLTARLRSKCFSHILSKQMGWHDLQNNARSKLVLTISEDCRKVRHAAPDMYLARGKAAGALMGALTISFYFCFRIALVVLGCIPFLVLGGVLRMRASMLASGHKSFQETQVFAGDAVRNISTVISIGAVAKFVEQYSDMLKEPERKTVRFAPIRGMMMAAAFAVIFLAFALNLYWGAVNVDHGWCDMGESITAIFAVIFGSLRAGAFIGESPDSNAGAKSARRVEKLLFDDSMPAPVGGDLGDKSKPCNTEGGVEYKDISFAYPSRSDSTVLKKFSVKISPLETVAIVGPSGSGKSTLVSLLNQFYTPTGGEIKLDGKRLSEYSSSYLRSIIGLVDQEPQLFSTTVRENVTYGLSNGNDVDDAQVWEALEAANAKDFVSELADGLHTEVGKFGSKLSGGQRQRVAISRLFLMKDKIKILLLDEATSALDTTSERLVQEGLERLRVGITTLVIAHRLSTIRDADRIIVLEHGRVREFGTHDELYDARGAYYRLVQNQSIEKRASQATVRASVDSI